MLPITASNRLQALALDHAGAWQAYGDVAAEAHDLAPALTTLIRDGDATGTAIDGPLADAVLRLTAARQAVDAARQVLKSAVIQTFKREVELDLDPYVSYGQREALAEVIDPLYEPLPDARLRPMLRGHGPIEQVGLALGAGGGGVAGAVAAVSAATGGSWGPSAVLGAVLLGSAAKALHTVKRPVVVPEEQYLKDLAELTTSAAHGVARGAWRGHVPLVTFVDHTGTIATQAKERASAHAAAASTLPRRLDEAIARANGEPPPRDAIDELRSRVTVHELDVAAGRTAALHELAGTYQLDAAPTAAPLPAPIPAEARA